MGFLDFYGSDSVPIVCKVFLEQRDLRSSALTSSWSSVYKNFWKNGFD